MYLAGWSRATDLQSGNRSNPPRPEPWALRCRACVRQRLAVENQTDKFPMPKHEREWAELVSCRPATNAFKTVLSADTRLTA